MAYKLRGRRQAGRREGQLDDREGIERRKVHLVAGARHASDEHAAGVLLRREGLLGALFHRVGVMVEVRAGADGNLAERRVARVEELAEKLVVGLHPEREVVDQVGSVEHEGAQVRAEAREGRSVRHIGPRKRRLVETQVRRDDRQVEERFGGMLEDPRQSRVPEGLFCRCQSQRPKRQAGGAASRAVRLVLVGYNRARREPGDIELHRKAICQGPVATKE